MRELIAVIGGAGFIGTKLVARLVAAGRPVRIVDRRPSARFPELCRPADIRDLAALESALAGCSSIVHLAAEHADDVQPRSLYHEVNVVGTANVCAAATRLGIEQIVFTSSVAVYGFAPRGTDETGATAPFNEYGSTKLEAERVLRQWAGSAAARTLVIVRLTVVFGERNRGNVHRLFSQIASGRFLLVGSGANVKSLAYVDNVAAFLEHALGLGTGTHLLNYVDTPDLTVGALVELVRRTLGRPRPLRLRIPFAVGYAAGLAFDLLALATGRPFAISSLRVRKLCADTQFAASRVRTTGFVPPVALEEGIRRTLAFEFLGGRERDDGVVYRTE